MQWQSFSKTTNERFPERKVDSFFLYFPDRILLSPYGRVKPLEFETDDTVPLVSVIRGVVFVLQAHENNV